MGTKTALSFAILSVFIAEIETNLLEQNNTKPREWKRYIDDVFPFEPATHKKFSSSLSTDQKKSRPLKKTLYRPKSFCRVKNSRSTKTILDRRKKFSTGGKLLDPREEISQDQYEFSNGGFASRLMG